MTKPISNVKITLIVPVYNAQKTLPRCLDSILHQNDYNMELILINDGSTDGSQSILENYLLKFPDQIRLLHTENNGQGMARNKGLELTTGEYVGFVDSDDYLSPDYFKVVREWLSSNPDMLVFSYQRHYSTQPDFYERNYPFTKNYPWETTNLRRHPEILCHTEGAPWMRLVRTSIFRQYQDLRFSASPIAQDVEFNSKLFLQLDAVKYCNKPLYNYVVNRSSATFKTENISWFSTLLDSVCAYYERHNQFEKYSDELEILFVKHLLISNFRRLKKSGSSHNIEVLDELRTKLLERFPRFHKNKYLRQEPLYVRVAVKMTYHIPWWTKIVFISPRTLKRKKVAS